MCIALTEEYVPHQPVNLSRGQTSKIQGSHYDVVSLPISFQFTNASCMVNVHTSSFCKMTNISDHTTASFKNMRPSSRKHYCAEGRRDSGNHENTPNIRTKLRSSVPGPTLATTPDITPTTAPIRSPTCPPSRTNKELLLIHQV